MSFPGHRNAPQNHVNAVHAHGGSRLDLALLGWAQDAVTYRVGGRVGFSSVCQPERRGQRGEFAAFRVTE